LAGAVRTGVSRTTRFGLLAANIQSKVELWPLEGANPQGPARVWYAIACFRREIEVALDKWGFFYVRQV
jgi:hypothetical protein